MKIRKSISKLLIVFGQSDLLDLINFNFLDLAKYATLDRFSIFPLILLQALLQLALLALADTALFLLSLVAKMLKALSFVIYNIEVRGTAILLKFLMNLL